MKQVAPHKPSPEIPASRVRFPVLDGWRGISILTVLACHLLPLGPKYLKLNDAAGPLGMSLFFTLSGFLITVTLRDCPDWRRFLIRRGCRILPLAFLYIVVALFILSKDSRYYAAHLCFTINYQTQFITEITSHFWSLCVEVHFYLAATIVVMVGGRKFIWIFPFLGLLITGLRILNSAEVALETHLRADEILAGATLALVNENLRWRPLRQLILRVPVVIWAILLLCSCHPTSGALAYCRPYFAMGLVGRTLWERTWLTRLLHSRILKYCASISYALYVIHPLAHYGWLSTGSKWQLYLLKRPITFAVTFVSAHFSTATWERKWIQWGKAWSQERSADTGVIAQMEPTI